MAVSPMRRRGGWATNSRGRRLDPYLRLEGPNGTVLPGNDDSVPQVNVNSRIVFEPVVHGLPRCHAPLPSVLPRKALDRCLYSS
jgi:hypothetical protein